MSTSQIKPLALQLEACIHPAATMSHVVAVLVNAVESLQASGVSVHGIHVETRDMGDGYLQALQDASGLAGRAVLPLNLSASPSISREFDSSTSTPANPLAAKTAPTSATSTDDGDSGASATENTPTMPPSSMSNAAQLRATKFLLSLAMSLLMVALALISIHSFIPANTTASTAVMGITISVMLLIQLCIAYPFLAL